MKRLRIERWGASFLPPRNPRLHCPFSSCTKAHSRQLRAVASPIQRRQLSTSRTSPQEFQPRNASDSFETTSASSDTPAPSITNPAVSNTPSIPQSSRAQSGPKSAKLAALHARLSLPARFPLSTLSRCLLDSSAEPNPSLNNASLALLGQDLLSYYTSEWLVCNYPRLPMPVLFAAQYAYVGPKTLSAMRAEWGVEAAAAPGPEVDAGLLQFTRVKPGNAVAEDGMSRIKDLEGIRAKGTGRTNEDWNYRRGTSSRIVYDNEFGDLQSGVFEPKATSTQAQDGSAAAVGELEQASNSQQQDLAGDEAKSVTLEDASATFIRAVFGALYLHSGASAVSSFHSSHILSRHLPLHTLFNFKYPTRDLSRLCLREGMEPPVARLISETGRLSRSPVFVVGVFSGREKLGEDAGSSLDEARVRAAANALRGWYLYSPPREDVRLPSQAGRGGVGWKPQMVDIGEIIT